jgi:demethylmenaquinone methyltransferase/2-methoxy-6-polyprenyl-1,4-benzoquinol methylase
MRRSNGTQNPLWSDELLSAPHQAPDKADRVRGMFNAIAPRYELVNTVFSAGRDAYWRRTAVALAKITGSDVVLDLACGTGDFARAFLKARPAGVIGCDFAHRMLTGALQASASAGRPAAKLWFVEGDALTLPFADAAFSVLSCAFGVRNFADLDAGLREMHRVLRPGGRVVILEFTRPSNRLFRRLYEFYTHSVMPWAATAISGDRSGAYRYLPRSVVSFLTVDEMASRLRTAGFANPTAVSLTLGIVNVYIAERP